MPRGDINVYCQVLGVCVGLCVCVCGGGGGGGTAPILWGLGQFPYFASIG